MELFRKIKKLNNIKINKVKSNSFLLVKRKRSKVIFKKKFSKRFKLKKKWRFWRFFKRYFLKSKKRKFFIRLKWLFFQRRIIWRQMVVLYGKAFKKKVFKIHEKKFGKCFFRLLSYLELRLNVFLVRINFVSKILDANKIISKKQVLVNFRSKKLGYLIKVNDLIEDRSSHNIRKAYKRCIKFWRRFSWHRWRRARFVRYKIRCLRSTLRWNVIRFAVIRNFVEIRQKTSLCVLLRNPFWGEIFIEKKRLYLLPKFIRKVFYFY